MKTSIRFCVGTLTGILTGVFLLALITGIGESLGGSGDYFEMFDEIAQGNLFAIVVAVSIFILPILTGMITGLSKKRGIWEAIVFPLITGILAVTLVFFVAFVRAVLREIISFFFGEGTIIEIAVMIALIIAFSAPAFKVIAVIIED